MADLKVRTELELEPVLVSARLFHSVELQGQCSSLGNSIDRDDG